MPASSLLSLSLLLLFFLSSFRYAALCSVLCKLHTTFDIGIHLCVFDIKYFIQYLRMRKNYQKWEQVVHDSFFSFYLLLFHAMVCLPACLLCVLFCGGLGMIARGLQLANQQLVPVCRMSNASDRICERFVVETLESSCATAMATTREWAAHCFDPVVCTGHRDIILWDRSQPPWTPVFMHAFCNIWPANTHTHPHTQEHCILWMCRCVLWGKREKCE